MPAPDVSHASPAFVTTRWEDVELFHGSGNEADSARDRFCRAYWHPLYVFLRVHLRNLGADAGQAQDSVQAFFEHALEKQIFRNATRGKGAFRSLLRASLQNFVQDEWKSAQRQKRRPVKGWVFVDDENTDRSFRDEFARFDSPEKAFDRAWVLQILEHSLQQVRESYSADKSLFDLIAPLLQRVDEEASYAELAIRAGKTEGAFRVAVHRSRQKFNELVKCEIARTIGWNGTSPKELKTDLDKDEKLKERFDEEYRHLLAALA